MKTVKKMSEANYRQPTRVEGLNFFCKEYRNIFLFILLQANVKCLKATKVYKSFQAKPYK